MKNMPKKKKTLRRPRNKLARFTSLNPDAFVPLKQPYFEVISEGKIELESTNREAVIKRANLLINSTEKKVYIARVNRSIIGIGAVDFKFADDAFLAVNPLSTELPK